MKAGVIPVLGGLVQKESYECVVINLAWQQRTGQHKNNSLEHFQPAEGSSIFYRKKQGKPI